MAIDANGRGVGDGVDGLRRDLAEAKAQLAATSEVLTALGRSASDLGRNPRHRRRDARNGYAAPTWRRSISSRASV